MRAKQPQNIFKHFLSTNFVALALTLALIVLCCLFVASHTGTNFLSHSTSDSYTLQALAWREGKTTLSSNYPWLELAIYQGEYYVSFPPTPSIPMLLLSFFFGAETPNGLFTLLYFLGGCAAAFFVARRTLSRAHAAATTLFVALGGSLLDIAVSGGGFSGAVWYQAQTLSFLLTMLSFLWVHSDRPFWRGAALVAIALAVGCRPLQALYVPFLLLTLYPRVKRSTALQTLRAALPYVAVPAVIAAAYGAYNMIRFDNPFQFGHAYLPEYINSGDTVFDLSKIWQNLFNIFRLPRIEEGVLVFSISGGFAVFLTNPMLPFGIARFLERTLGKKTKATDCMLLATVIVHFVSFLTHRTNGGWQYGTRYLIDTVPAMLYLFTRGKKTVRLFESLAIGALILFNVYGTIVFHAR